MIAPVLSVASVDASFDFYTQKLGFRGGSKLPGPDGRSVFANVYQGEAYQILLAGQAPPTSKGRPADELRGAWFEIYVSLPAEKDIDALYASIMAKGATISEPLRDQDWGERTFCVTDLDGSTIRFAKETRPMTMDELSEVSRNRKTAG